MSSIHTNHSSIAALQNLRSVSSRMSDTQQQISSGLRVGQAADDAAYWSIATTMRSENLALSAVSDSIGLGRAILDTTYAGMEQVLDYFHEFKNLLVMAKDQLPAVTNGTWYDYERDSVYDGTALGKLDLQMRELFDAMTDTIAASSFNGVNLLQVEKGGRSLAESVSFVTGIQGSTILTTDVQLKDVVLINYNRTGDFYDNQPGAEEQGILDGKVDIVTYELFATYFSSSTGKVERNGDHYIIRNGLWNYNNTPPFSSQPLETYFDDFMNGVEGKIEKLTQAMATVGSLQTRMAIQDKFVTLLSDHVESGIGRLVDADMNEASTRLKALQTQEQLSVQALSIANTSADVILSLFRQ
ncbi:flagellin [Rhizobium sp. AAP116]|uniref:flagellin N-terminal helical domain-containing protein n=1 Tax=Rhizobium sp. AAP116 TaxID=1523429 RepID=UPI0009E90DFD|nr:flagellin [Rhizobium sp. AAP116]